MERGGFTYILTTKKNTTLYTGVSSDLYDRIYKHKTKVYPGFTARYNIDKLVFFRGFSSIEEAIDFEKYIKGKSRQFKIDLINSFNPEWRDLFEEIKEW